MNRYGPCMCGATDCLSCGQAQGYEIIKVWRTSTNRWEYVNPEDIEDGDIREDDYPPREYEE